MYLQLNKFDFLKEFTGFLFYFNVKGMSWI